ncbi:MAG: anaerobic ribonucleoside-triphosphate reductase activating protein [Lachnospiraceae bacterium]|nr:anaerobic ribonucleoside-triphosphate reductase activating protein [Lachnospiraceae bacterium]
MKIHGISGLSLLDYPGNMACTVFTGHCNYRCPFCHNAGLVLNPDSEPVIPEEKVFDLLEKRKGKLEGVAITGGEPTLNRDLPDFCRRVKDTGVKVKLDTNGSNPGMLAGLIDEGLVDYVAMDIKAAPDNYTKAVGIDNFDMGQVFESVDIIMKAGNDMKIDYEFRTTVVGGIHTDKDFEKTGRWIKGAKAYYLQGYRVSEGQLNPEGLFTVPAETMEKYREILLPNIPNTSLRGVL